MAIPDYQSIMLPLLQSVQDGNTYRLSDIKTKLSDDYKLTEEELRELFTNTQIPACIWFLSKSKETKDKKLARQGEVLIIDARKKGYMKDRILRDFTLEDVKDIADTFHNWQRSSVTERSRSAEEYQDIPGFCKSATLEDIRKNDYILTPGRYVGATAQEEDAEPFAEKMTRLTSELKGHFKEGNQLEAEIKKTVGRAWV